MIACKNWALRPSRLGYVQTAKIAALSFLFLSGTAGSAGFEIFGQNPLGFSAAFAGGTAVAEDASIAYYNPAAMIGLDASKLHIAGALGLVSFSTRYTSNGASVAPLFTTLGNDDGGNGGDWALIGNAAMVIPISPDVSVGFSVLSPFGNRTKYHNGWMGRFHARESDLTTLNLTGSIAYRLNDVLSVGLGITRQRATAKITSAVNYAGLVASAAALIPALAPLIGVTPEGSSEVSGDSTAWSGNAGLWLRPNDGTALGLTYRARISHRIEGDAAFSRTGNPVIDAVLENPASPAKGGRGFVDLTLPAGASFSLSHQLSRTLDLLADVSWTEWNPLQTVDVRYLNGDTITTVNFRYRNTVRSALGISYALTERAKLRAGIAWDPTPVVDEFRSPILPDSDRLVFSFGGKYVANRSLVVDAGVLLFRYKDAPVRTGAESAQTAAARGILSGSFDTSSAVFVVQLSSAF